MPKNSIHKEAFNEILYGTGINFVLAAIGSVLMFFVKLVGARYFGPSDYGLFEMINTIIGIFVVLGVMGIDYGTVMYIPIYRTRKQWAELNGYIRFVFFLPLIISVVLGGILFVFAGPISNYYKFGSLFTLMLKIISVTIPIKVVNRLIDAVFVSYKRMFLGRFGRGVIEPLVLLLELFIIVFFKFTILSFIIALALSIVFSLFFHLIF